MPTHAEPVACCGPLAVEPLNSWDWYGRGQPVTLSRTPSRMAARPPEFGEQTDEVLSEFGFSTEEISELRQAKVV